MFPIDVGVTSLPTSPWDVLTAIGTVGAAGVAAVSIIREHLLRRENDRLRTVAQEKVQAEERTAAEQAQARYLAARRSQAELVLAWYEPRFVRQGFADLSINVLRPFAILLNHSGAPVFDVRVSVMEGLVGDPSTFDNIRVLPASEGTRDLPIITDDDLEDEGATTWKAWVTFRDLAGVWWKRYESGELRELTEQEVAHLSTAA